MWSQANVFQGEIKSNHSNTSHGADADEDNDDADDDDDFVDHSCQPDFPRAINQLGFLEVARESLPFICRSPANKWPDTDTDTVTYDILETWHMANVTYDMPSYWKHSYACHCTTYGQTLRYTWHSDSASTLHMVRHMTIWPQKASHSDSKLSPNGCRVVAKWSPSGRQVVTMWSPSGRQVVNAVHHPLYPPYISHSMYACKH